MNAGVQLFDAGYTDLVLIKPNDKAPAHTGWLHNRPTRERVRDWSGGFGIIGELLPAVDIDLHDELLSEVVALMVATHLGPAPLRTSHRPASKLLVYRCDAPFAKKVLTLPDGQGIIEILGRGRQYLVSGTHPEGTPYAWAGKDLWEISPHKLSLVTEADIDRLLLLLQEEFGGLISTGGAKKDREDVDQEELLAPSLEHVEAALQDIPNTDAFLAKAFPEHSDPRDAWVAMAHAVYGAGGPGAEGIFVEWTDTYADGVVDLGLAARTFQSCGDTYTGWPTLERLLREAVQKSVEEMGFVADLGPRPEPVAVWEPNIKMTDEFFLDKMMPILKDQVVCSGKSWFVWTGFNWERDTDGFAAEAALRKQMRAFALRLQEEADAYEDPDPKEEERVRKALMKRASYLQNANGIRNLFSLLKGRVQVPMSAFDTDLMALNTPAGIVDLKTGTMHPATPADMVSRITEAAPVASYDPTEAPHWEKFLDHLCSGDPEVAGYLQRYMGYSLTGRMGEKAFAFAWGSSTNTGKSTYINAVVTPLGTYHCGVDVDLFMQKRQTDYVMASLPGVRLVTATEPSAGQKWDDKLIKAITGGDQIQAREIYGSPFTYTPQFKVLIAGNHEPELQNVDTPLLKRINIVPMNKVVATPDKALGEKLAVEGPQILRWMIEGARAWLREGLNPPAAVQAATNEYREDADTVQLWIDECCELDPELHEASTNLFSSWEAWNKRRGSMHPMRHNPFSRELNARSEQLNLVKYRTKQERGFNGIGLKARVALGTDILEEFNT